MNIYTRTGDQGQTSLVGGQRVSKTCARLESYGTIDELCSHIGLLITYCASEHDIQFLTDIQGQLFVVGGYLATDNTQKEVRPGNIVTEDMVTGFSQEDAEPLLSVTSAAPSADVPNAASLPLSKKVQKWLL